MKVEIIPDTFDKNIYNTLAHHPLQAWEWGEARKKLGTEVLRIGEFEKTLRNVYQMTIHPIPKTGYRIGYIPRSGIPSRELRDFLYEYGQNNKFILIKFEPDVNSNTNITITDNHLHRSPHPLFTDWTQVLDLRLNEEDIMDRMKSKTRYNIKLALKKGVTIKEETTEEGFKIFAQLYFETCKRQKYYGHNHAYHKTIWDTLKNTMAHILIAYYEQQPLAAYELFFFNKTLYYTYGGTSDKHRNVMAANLLMWEAIRLGKKLGATSFDMWGSLPPQYDETNPRAGFTRFKEGYGTEFVQKIGSYDLIIHPVLYTLYNTAYTLRQWWLRIQA